MLHFRIKYCTNLLYEYKTKKELIEYYKREIKSKPPNWNNRSINWSTGNYFTVYKSRLMDSVQNIPPAQLLQSENIWIVSGIRSRDVFVLSSRRDQTARGLLDRLQLLERQTRHASRRSLTREYCKCENRAFSGDPGWGSGWTRWVQSHLSLREKKLCSPSARSSLLNDLPAGCVALASSSFYRCQANKSIFEFEMRTETIRGGSVTRIILLSVSGSFCRLNEAPLINLILLNLQRAS